MARKEKGQIEVRRTSMPMIMVAATLLLASGVALAATITCEGGGFCEDTDQGDFLSGDSEGDVGNDTIAGGAGADTILDGFGKNTLSGGDGNDDILGNGQLSGGDGNDYLGTPNSGSSSTASGGDGLDVISSREESDILCGGKSVDLVKGGKGNDTSSGDESGDFVWPQEGTDKSSGGGGDDVLIDSTFVSILKSGDEAARGSGVRVSRQVRRLLLKTFGPLATRTIEVSNGDASKDIFSAGGGNDRLFVDSVPTSTDIVSCGSGRDTVTADSKDVVANDCEKVLKRTIPLRLR